MSSSVSLSSCIYKNVLVTCSYFVISPSCGLHHNAWLSIWGHYFLDWSYALGHALCTDICSCALTLVMQRNSDSSHRCVHMNGVLHTIILLDFKPCQR